MHVCTYMHNFHYISFMEKEVWKPVKGYEGFYEVSDLGRVKSLSREVHHYMGGTRKIRERILKPGSDAAGYRVVKLSVENASPI